MVHWQIMTNGYIYLWLMVILPFPSWSSSLPWCFLVDRSSRLLLPKTTCLPERHLLGCWVSLVSHYHRLLLRNWLANEVTVRVDGEQPWLAHNIGDGRPAQGLLRLTLGGPSGFRKRWCRCVQGGCLGFIQNLADRSTKLHNLLVEHLHLC